MSSTQRSYGSEPDDGLPGFSCESHPEGPGVIRVTPSGELDIATAPRLGAALAEVPDVVTLVILDLTEVTFVDSSGLQVICTAYTRLAKTDCHLVVVPGGHQVQRLFELTGLERQLDFVSARDSHGLAPVSSE